MDTELYFKDGEMVNKIYTSGTKYVFLESESSILTDFAESNRHLVEINQLFDSYLFNLSNLHSFYELFFGDNIRKKATAQFAYEVEDRISINVLTNNLVSAAVTLINAMEVFVKWLSENNYLSQFDEIKLNWTSNAYDTSFEYRFFFLLRNFMQHNHLSVSVLAEADGKIRCCFDLAQILNTPHFNMKSEIKKELKNLAKKMEQGLYKHSGLAYTITIAKFHVKTLDLYCQYFEIIDTAIENICTLCNSCIDSNKNALKGSADELEGFVVYESENVLHAFEPNPDFYCNKFAQMKKRAHEIYSQDAKALEGIK